MNIWKKAHQLLTEQKRIIFLKVVWHKGSSPGKQGFSMLVCEDGLLLGSIGGGRTEFQLVEEAKEMLKQSVDKMGFRKQVHREDDADSSGMICAGEQWVVLMPLHQAHLSEVAKISTENTGTLSITSQQLAWNENINPDTFQFDFQSENDWFYSENINQKALLYLIGGGHVGLATAKIFQDLDFDVTMLDNREGLNTFEQNTFSDAKKIIDFNEITKHIVFGNQTYIVILTHNFSSDSQILTALQGMKVKYIGVLGSKSKVKSMFKSMIQNDVNSDFLKTVDAPIGMPINSVTPAEIGISIAAKVIAVKNNL